MNATGAAPLPFYNKAGTWCWVSLVAGLAVLVILRQFPQFDVAFSGVFFETAECDGQAEAQRNCGLFFVTVDPFWKSLRRAGLYIPMLVMASMLVWLIWQNTSKKPLNPVARFAPLLGIGSAILGPGLIVNGILKAYWGRPRPLTTQDFGGEHPFVLPGTMTDYCTSNCSFVSGEASAAFWMLWVVPFLPRRWRWPIGIGIVVVACCTAVLRVAFGRHYFSDVVMSAMISAFAVTFTAWLLQTGTLSRWIGKMNR